jgi:hypothetical protein
MAAGATASSNIMLHNSGGRLGPGLKVESDILDDMTSVVGCSVWSSKMPTKEPGSTTYRIKRECFNQTSNE